jgi:uncharacterized protein (TIGR01777 family)
VTLRTALVLGRGAAALDRLLTVFRLGLGARLGSGQQWMTWVHLEDLVGIILHGIAEPELHGAVNAAAPEPVRNVDFTRTLASSLSRPALLWAPGLGLRILLGEFAEALLASQRVIPRAAEESGFGYRYADLRSALSQVTGRVS